MELGQIRLSADVGGTFTDVAAFDETTGELRLGKTLTTPARLVRPTVGLIPTTPLAFAGQTMLPSVSVPSETAAKLAETAAPDPELEPQGLRSMP